ncbi:MAG: hypothetical protein K6A82_06100 [Prevotella sp.]|nr:hypothetical protein [Prevotella sp.]
MEATVNLGLFLKLINSMSLFPHNKRCLGERLINEAKEEVRGKDKEKLSLLDSIAGSWKNVGIDTMKHTITEGRETDNIQKLTMFDED